MADLRAIFTGRKTAAPSRGERIETLYREHNETLLRFLRARLQTEADAHEAAQEAYVRVLQLDAGAEPAYLKAYLFRTAENVARDLKRRQGTRRRAGELPIGLDEIGPVEAPEVGQEARLAAAQELSIAARALNELPPKCRLAMVLRRRDGWPVSRIAEHLGVSPRMVHLYLERALEHLSAALGDAHSPQPKASGASK